jgi:hypothetical protein
VCLQDSQGHSSAVRKAAVHELAQRTACGMFNRSRPMLGKHVRQLISTTCSSCPTAGVSCNHRQSCLPN